MLPLSGGLLGLAIITRTSELLWLAPMLIILWLFNIKKISITKLIIFISFLSLSFVPVFYWNQVLYNSFFSGGYFEMNQSLANITQASSDLVQSTASGHFTYHRQLLSKIKNNIFHFGWQPEHSREMLYYYFIKMFYWIFAPALFGLILFFQKWKTWKGRHRAYLASYFVAFFILLFYYGAWGFHDNPDQSQVTIGNSYTRYWLPLYLGAMPFASVFIIKFTRLLCFRLKHRRLKGFCVSALRVITVAIIMFISIKFVLSASDEGLAPSAQRQKSAREEFNKVISLTEHNAVIITQYHDKLFFPERKVIVGLFDNKETVGEYAGLANYLPLYYYNFALPQDAIDYLNQSRLGEVGLRIEEVEQITEEFTLYKLRKNIN